MSDWAVRALELRTPVAAILRQAAANAIMPRFRQLRRSDVTEKTPGEWVTVADRDSECILADGLAAILPAARVIGEEACAADASLLEGLEEGLVWLVDPLDGTANFASGHEPFGLIVALAYEGETLAGWLYDPLTDRLCFAARGQGAQVSIGTQTEPMKISADPEKPIVTLATQFMPAALRDQVVAAAEEAFDVRPIPRCAAEHYPRLCFGENHVALFQRTLPWDHAAGALLLTEAGGHVARWDGAPYCFHDGGLGILAASTPRLWERAADVLLNGGLPHEQAKIMLTAPVKIADLPH